MAREFKIGAVVIGVLAAVFVGLLVKGMTRPTKLPVASIPADSDAPADEPIRIAPAPIRATVVTPEVDSTPVVHDIAAQDSQPYGSTHWSTSGDRYAQPANETAPSTTAFDSTNGTPASGDLSSTATNDSMQYGTQDSRYAGDYNAPVEHSTGYATDSAQTGSAQAESDQNVAASQPENTPSDPFQSRSWDQTPATTGAPEPSRYDEYDSEPSNSASMNNTQLTEYQDPSTSSRGAAPSVGMAQYGQPVGGSTAPQGYRHAPVATPISNAPRAYAQPERMQPTASTHGYNTPAPATSGTHASGSGGQSQWSGATLTGEVTAPGALPTARGIERNGEQYTVGPNDSFWMISEQAYGTGAFFKALYEYNRKRHKQADELVVGQELLVPDENVLRRHYPDLCPRPRRPVASSHERLVSISTKLRGGGRIYTVVDGDTLFEIARYELGKPSRWAEIYELNRDVLGEDFDYLRPGTELILPSEPLRGGNVTRQIETAAPSGSLR